MPTVLLLFAAPLSAQQRDSTLLQRWVGNYLERPLTIEFYGDTMLVVGDRHALSYLITRDSIIAAGDTSLAVRYRLSFGRLLLETRDGTVITMAPQRTLARQLAGRWAGDIDTSGTAQPGEVELRADRTARWHALPDGAWATGEWERETRAITLTWDDGAEWNGVYDPQRNSLLFEPVADSTNTKRGAAGVLRRVFR